MSDIILHHYAFSPYSEKLRAMLAYSELGWASVIHKEAPPRKELEVLTGGYKRIPVAQIGADIFCDSNIIAAEIAELSGKPELDLYQASQEVKDFVEHVEGKIFFAGVLGAGSSKLRKKVLKQMSLWDLAKFLIDRVNMGRTATTSNMIKPGRARGILLEHLQDMEQRIEQDFLFGPKPCIADFAAYHSLWFVKDVGECGFIRDFPKVCAWMERLQSLGEVRGLEMSAKEALAEAKANEPRPLKLSLNSDKIVSIGPADYRHSQTEGYLRFDDDNRWVVERSHHKVGNVHVHFPKKNYKESALFKK